MHDVWCVVCGVCGVNYVGSDTCCEMCGVMEARSVTPLHAPTGTILGHSSIDRLESTMTARMQSFLHPTHVGY